MPPVPPGSYAYESNYANFGSCGFIQGLQNSVVCGNVFSSPIELRKCLTYHG